MRLSNPNQRRSRADDPQYSERKLENFEDIQLAKYFSSE